jgi:hypothetical protein
MAFAMLACPCRIDTLPPLRRRLRLPFVGVSVGQVFAVRQEKRLDPRML